MAFNTSVRSFCNFAISQIPARLASYSFTARLGLIREVGRAVHQRELPTRPKEHHTSYYVRLKPILPHFPEQRLRCRRCVAIFWRAVFSRQCQPIHCASASSHWVMTIGNVRLVFHMAMEKEIAHGQGVPAFLPLTESETRPSPWCCGPADGRRQSRGSSRFCRSIP